MSRGKNPHSLANLTNDGRPKRWGDRKRREVLVSEEGWEGSQAAAKAVGCSGVSELLEKLGRGALVIAVQEGQSSPATD